MNGATLKAVFDTVLMMVKNKESIDEIKKYMDDSIQWAKAEDIVGGLNSCKACNLNCQNKVCGEGEINSKLMLIGEA